MNKHYSAAAWREQTAFNAMIISTLYMTNTLSWIFIVLAHWNNSPRVDMSLHTLSWFRAIRSLLLLLNAVWLAEQQQKPISQFGLPWPGLEPTIYSTRCEHINRTPSMCYTSVVYYNYILHVTIHDQHAKLDFHSAISLTQQSMCRHVAPLGTQYHD